MPVPTSLVLPLLGAVRDRLDADLSLAALARVARRSPSEVHRAFRRVTGETTKRYTTRLRLDHAAVQLVVTTRPILDVALAAGFASHEVFTRAFLRRFGMSPRAYRARGLRGAPHASIAGRHAAVVRDAGPCIGLHHLDTADRRSVMTTPVTRKQLTPTAALVIRRKTAMSEIAQTLGECLPRVFAWAQQHGVPFAGPPFTRYVEVGRGMMTIEGGMPIAAPSQGEGDIEPIELPGGPAATAIHHGSYETLHATYVVIEKWIAEQKLEVAGPPWEVYLTDPGTTPDPQDWRTEIVFPLKQT